MSRKTFFIGSSLQDIREFPEEVRREIGFALHLAEGGDRAINAVPLAGFGSAMVPEVIVDHDGDTFRAVYTVKFKEAVYVLHAFKKKSKKGRETPKKEIDLVRQRLKAAETHYEEHFGKNAKRKRNANLQGR
ncbi:type II toxin-antitoxin system RelE/ParE family toxin [Mesorhizobium sp. YR577]|uniref:type II toxin-antitoxin system RelE/ParE family toxin n=1 Tax=Mesorhizobium sp. YR577 TaxID=1884373 RepID=UPI0008E2DFAD|nr:type II toxin-antitoxin system RelE/ParE family toxin [Mesorhizobium sp. YR577]SFU21046.1 Phage-related protein [Mesorhizobium sp. YR577]